MSEGKKKLEKKVEQQHVPLALSNAHDIVTVINKTISSTLDMLEQLEEIKVLVQLGALEGEDDDTFLNEGSGQRNIQGE